MTLKKTKPTAQIVDGALVAAFPDAKTPCTWQMDLTRVHAAAFEVREDNSAYVLGVKGTKGDVSDIATYEDKEKAVQALGLITAALLGTKPGSGKWLKIMLALLAIFVVLIVLASGSGGLSSTSPDTIKIPQRQMTPGVPTPAEDLLNR